MTGNMRLASGFGVGDYNPGSMNLYYDGLPQQQVSPSTTNFGPSGMGTLDKASLAMQGITGAMGAWNAYNQNKLMKKQFNASLADRNQNIANQAATTNLALNNQAIMAAQMMGHKVGTQGFNEYVAKNRVQVDGSPIKA